MTVPRRPSIRPTSVTVAAPDPRGLAAFYAKLLGVEVGTLEGPRPGEPVTAGWAQLRAANLTLNFEFERHWCAPVWPARPGQPGATQHLDLQVDELAAAVAWAQECGATLAAQQPQEQVRVLFDPAGHPFCLFV